MGKFPTKNSEFPYIIQLQIALYPSNGLFWLLKVLCDASSSWFSDGVHSGGNLPGICANREWQFFEWYFVLDMASRNEEERHSVSRLLQCNGRISAVIFGGHATGKWVDGKPGRSIVRPERMGCWELVDLPTNLADGLHRAWNATGIRRYAGG